MAPQASSTAEIPTASVFLIASESDVEPAGDARGSPPGARTSGGVGGVEEEILVRHQDTEAAAGERGEGETLQDGQVHAAVVQTPGGVSVLERLADDATVVDADLRLGRSDQGAHAGRIVARLSALQGEERPLVDDGTQQTADAPDASYQRAVHGAEAALHLHVHLVAPGGRIRADQRTD